MTTYICWHFLAYIRHRFPSFTWGGLNGPRISIPSALLWLAIIADLSLIVAAVKWGYMKGLQED